MNCQKWDETIMRYFDGTLSDIETAALKQHINHCARCTEQFNQFDEIFGSLEYSEEVSPPQEFEEAVMSKINAYVITKKQESRKVQTTLVVVMISIFSVPLVFLGMLFSNISLFQMILDARNYISYLLNLWNIGSVFIRSSNILFAGLDLLIKTSLAILIIFLSLAIASKIKLSRRIGLN